MCLEIKAAGLGGGSASTFLARAVEPPPRAAVEAALASLLDAGAIEPSQPKEMADKAERAENAEEAGVPPPGAKAGAPRDPGEQAEEDSEAQAAARRSWARSDPLALLRRLSSEAQAKGYHLATRANSNSLGGGGSGGGGGGERAPLDDSELVLTPLGRILATLPVDVKLGKASFG